MESKISIEFKEGSAKYRVVMRKVRDKVIWKFYVSIYGRKILLSEISNEELVKLDFWIVKYDKRKRVGVHVKSWEPVIFPNIPGE